MSSNPHEGGCACGAVRYRLTRDPLFVHCCHCTWCQRETGSAFVLNALIEKSCVETIDGTPDRVATPSNSGKGQDFMRCPSCRVALWSHYAGLGERMAFIRVGTLDEPARTPPDIHIFTSTKQPWVVLPDDALVKTGYYKWKECWPEESQKRRLAMKG